jgi:hypothetical protein
MNLYDYSVLQFFGTLNVDFVLNVALLACIFLILHYEGAILFKFCTVAVQKSATFTNGVHRKKTYFFFKLQQSQLTLLENFSAVLSAVHQINQYNKPKCHSGITLR